MLCIHHVAKYKRNRNAGGMKSDRNNQSMNRFILHLVNTSLVNRHDCKYLLMYGATIMVYTLSQVINYNFVQTYAQDVCLY